MNRVLNTKVEQKKISLRQTKCLKLILYIYISKKLEALWFLCPCLFSRMDITL